MTAKAGLSENTFSEVYGGRRWSRHPCQSNRSFFSQSRAVYFCKGCVGGVVVGDVCYKILKVGVFFGEGKSDLTLRNAWSREEANDVVVIHAGAERSVVDVKARIEEAGIDSQMSHKGPINLVALLMTCRRHFRGIHGWNLEAEAPRE